MRNPGNTVLSDGWVLQLVHRKRPKEYHYSFSLFRMPFPNNYTLDYPSATLFHSNTRKITVFAPPSSLDTSVLHSLNYDCKCLVPHRIFIVLITVIKL